MLFPRRNQTSWLTRRDSPLQFAWDSSAWLAWTCAVSSPSSFPLRRISSSFSHREVVEAFEAGNSFTLPTILLHQPFREEWLPKSRFATPDGPIVAIKMLRGGITQSTEMQGESEAPQTEDKDHSRCMGSAQSGKRLWTAVESTGSCSSPQQSDCSSTCSPVEGTSPHLPRGFHDSKPAQVMFSQHVEHSMSQMVLPLAEDTYLAGSVTTLTRAWPVTVERISQEIHQFQASKSHVLVLAWGRARTRRPLTDGPAPRPILRRCTPAHGAPLTLRSACQDQFATA